MADDLEYWTVIGDVARIHFWKHTEEKADLVEQILENYELPHPLTGEVVPVFTVVNREEMDSGIDEVVGQLGGFAEDGIPGNKRGALYSEWMIDGVAPPYAKARWPHLFVFVNGRFSFPLRFQNISPQESAFVASHNGLATTWIPIALSGPGIRPGNYMERSTLSDIAPTLYHLLGLRAPEHVDGNIMSWVLE